MASCFFIHIATVTQKETRVELGIDNHQSKKMQFFCIQHLNVHGIIFNMLCFDSEAYFGQTT